MELILSDRLEHNVHVVIRDSSITFTPYVNDVNGSLERIGKPITLAATDLLGRIEAMIGTRDEEASILVAAGGSPVAEVVIGWSGASPDYDTVSFGVRGEGQDYGAVLAMPLPDLRQALGIRTRQ